MLIESILIGIFILLPLGILLLWAGCRMCSNPIFNSDGAIEVPLMILGIILIFGGPCWVFMELGSPQPQIPQWTATDDIEITTFLTNTPKVENVGSSEICIGRLTTNLKHEALIKFDLTNKPKKWAKVEISLYVKLTGYSKFDNFCFSVDIFQSDWTEHKLDHTIQWIIYNITSVNQTKGLQKIDITEYIKDYENISIRIYISTMDKAWIKIFSSEWRGYDNYPYNKSYLPQLIYT